MARIEKGSESLEQHTFIQYLRLKNIPIIANVNENIWSGILVQLLGKVRAYKIIASIEKKMKYLGKQKGIPDLFIPVPNTRYGGMYIEMKYGRNKPTKEQDFWLKTLTARGYYCVICYSCKEAIVEFSKYNKIPKSKIVIESIEED